MNTVTTTLVTARGRFGVREHGTAGEQVVCIHGFPDDASTFDGLAASSADAGYRVTAFNLRGYAPSPLEGPLDLDAMVDDLLAVVDAVSPNKPVHLIGHDYGAQLAYPALARARCRFASATLFSGAHPAYLQRNARRAPRQAWMSRYILYFQLRGWADRHVARGDFAYIDRLWRRWAAPDWTPPPDHLRHVKRTLAASWPAPMAMYRAGGFNVPTDPITAPTLFICGASDGCALPLLADGQDELFTNDYRREVWNRTGHFPHLEQPQRTAQTVLDWISTHPIA
ncbi:MAG: alpha/beta fold hydrolase [Dermatophilaceae bacterium]